MANSINTNIAAYFAQANISNAANLSSASVARLSSGNRIVQASDDVAALAIGTSLGTQVSALRTAQTNANQGTSLLQVADGALAQIQSILQQMRSLANQAQSGTLTNTDRGFLNQQFQALSDQIDALATGTTFNGVALIDGSTSGGTSITTNITDGSTALPVTAAIGTVGSVVSGDTFTLKIAGQATQTFTFGTATTDVGVGATAADSAANLAAAINNSGLSQLANVRVVATGANLTAYYTGSASSISNIPTITSGQTGGHISSTGTASFGGGTTLATITGTINANDTFTLGSHTITFVASGATGAQVNIGVSNTATLANLATYFNTNSGSSGFEDIANITFTSDADELFGVYSGSGSTRPVLTSTYTIADPIIYSGGAQNVNAAQAVVTLSTSSLTNGASTLTIGGQAFTFSTSATSGNAIQYTGGTGNSITQTLADIVSVLNGTVVNAALTGNYAGAVFSSDATHIYATNPNTSAITNLAAATLVTAGSVGATFNNSVAIPSAKQALITIGGGGAVIDTTDDVSINGVTATGGTDFLIGATDTDTLANIANYYNSVAGQAALASASPALTNLTFSSDATHLYATNTATTNGSNTNTVTVAHTGFVGTDRGAGVIEDGINSVLTTSSVIGAGTTLTIGNQTVTFGASGSGANVTIGTSGTLATDRATTLTNLAAYLNTISSSFDGTNGIVAGNTFTADTTSLYVKNSSSASITPLAVAFNSGTPQSLVTNTSLAAPSLVGSISGSGTIIAGDTFTFTGSGGGAQTFTIVASGGSGLNVNIGVNNAATLDNLVAAMNANTALGTTSYLNFSTDGTNIYAQDKNAGATTTVTSSFTSTGTATFTGITNGTVSSDSVSGLGAGTTSAVGIPSGSLFVNDDGTSVTNYGTGVDLSGISNNASFVGAFNKITASYVSTGTTSTSGVQFRVTIGDDTYTTNTVTNASLTSTTAPVTLTFTGSNTITSAAEGGSFTLTLQPQTAVSSQNQADQLATGINAALASVSAYQNRNVLSYNNNYSAEVSGVQVATLAGSSLAFHSDNFTNASISSISVSAPSTGSTDAKISAVINGDTFSTVSGIGDTFSANNEIVLVNESNPNETLILTLGASGSADLSNDSNAAAFQGALEKALGLDSVSGGLTFQLGSTADANVSVRLASAKTSTIFSGADLDISTQIGAAEASEVVGRALDAVTASRSNVGALESRFAFAAAALQTSVQNQGAAQSQLLDTDIAAEATNFATNQVKLQAGISVLAQANQQLQALLKLIG